MTRDHIKQKLKKIIAKHDAKPRRPWIEVQRNTYIAAPSEASREQWLSDFAEDIEGFLEQVVQEMLK